MKRILMIVAGAMLASAAQARPAIVVHNAPGVRVSYADLDLHSVAGRGALMGRVRLAAETLCLANGREPVAVSLDRIRCFHGTVQAGAAQMNRIAR